MQDRKIRLAHQAMMLDDAQQLLAINRQQIRAHGRVAADLPDLPENDMGIHIGDVHVAPAALASASSSLGKLLAVGGLIAGLAATGGMGAWLLASTLRQPLLPAKPLEAMEFEIPWRLENGTMQIGPARSVAPNNVATNCD